MTIPTDLTEFLHWIKERTETFWSKDRSEEFDPLLCEEWMHNAKWQGLSNQEIDTIEETYQIKFTPAHRSFLKVLHTIDKKQPLWSYEEGEEEEIIGYRSYFYNWKTDKKDLEEYFNWPYETMLHDVLGRNQFWLKSWGKVRPMSDKEKTAVFAQWFKQLPPCLPIFGHRFVLELPELADNPVLSIYGTDTIVYGWNMRHYLLSELSGQLDLLEAEYDEETTYYSLESNDFLSQERQKAFSTANKQSIPVWEEVILYWSSGWRGYME